MEDKKEEFLGDKPIQVNLEEAMAKTETIFSEADKKEKVEVDAEIKKKNTTFQELTKRFNQKFTADVDGIDFIMKPISVQVWDRIGGKDATEDDKTYAVWSSLVSPILTRDEFDMLPAPIKYQLYLLLMQNFFGLAGRISTKKS